MKRYGLLLLLIFVVSGLIWRPAAAAEAKGDLAGLTVSERMDGTEKAVQTITVKKTEYSKKLNSAPFVVKAETDGDGVLTWESLNPEVITIDRETGMLAYAGTGTARIRIQASATANYEEAEAFVTIKVTKPSGTSFKKVTALGKKKVKYTWNKTSGVTGCQIQYSKSSTFASGNKSLKVAGADTLSKTITMPEAEKKYYVRIRTYVTIGDKTWCSAWSETQSVTTKLLMENWVRIPRAGYEPDFTISGCKYYYTSANNSKETLYTLYKMDSKGNEKKLMTFQGAGNFTYFYTDSDYIVVNERMTYGGVVFRYNMDGSGKTMLVDLRTTKGGCLISSLAIYKNTIYYTYSSGFTYYPDTYKVKVIGDTRKTTTNKTVAIKGMGVNSNFYKRYIPLTASSGKPIKIYDAAKDVTRTLTTSQAYYERAGEYWYFAKFAKTTSGKGRYTIYRKPISAAGTAEQVASYVYKGNDVHDILHIDEEGVYYLAYDNDNPFATVMYSFKEKKIVKSDYFPLSDKYL